MIIYNITINIDASIHEEWLQWMKDEVFYFALQTQLPVKYKSFKVLEIVDENEQFLSLISKT